MSAAAAEASKANFKLVNVRTETELSLFYRVLRKLIRPLRPRLVRPGKPVAGGGSRLGTYPRMKNDFIIRERLHEASGLWLYDFEPLAPPNIKVKPPSTIYYFAGGGFQGPPARAHWRFLGRLAGRLMLDHHVVLVGCPLAPHSPAADALPALRRLVAAELAAAAHRHAAVTLMGDSSGGNLALSLAWWWAAEVAAPSGDRALCRVLERVVLVSPAVDLRPHTAAGPDAVAAADRLDPLLGAAHARAVADAWVAAPPVADPVHPRGASSLDDPYISPVNHSPEAFRLLADLGIEVHGVYGTCDVLAPDIDIFRNKCEENGVKGTWLVWVGQMHCFVLAGTYGLREGKKAFEWLVKMLSGDDDFT